MRSVLLAAVAALSLAAVSPVLAAGNLAAKPTELELKIDTLKLSFSQSEFDLETGKYYIMHISSDGEDEIAVQAPELWRNSWIDQVVVNNLEVTPYGLYSIEFDDAGTFDVRFMPIRPGEYQIYVPGYEKRGLTAKVVVK